MPTTRMKSSPLGMVTNIAESRAKTNS